MRVVLDTNVVVSALLFRAGRLAWMREAWVDGKLVPLVSRDTLTELMRVLGYTKFGLEPGQAKDLLAFYLENAEMVGNVRTKVRIPLCRDPDGRAFLRLAYAARAQALVTGDAGLLAVAAQSKVSILAPEILRQKLG